MFKKIIYSFIFIITIVVLSACGNDAKKEGTATTYMINRSEYIAYAKVSVKGDILTDVIFEEASLPNTWAKLKVTSTNIPDDVIQVGNIYYGKYLVIGDKHFTGELRNEPLIVNGKEEKSQTVKYFAEGINDLYTWLVSKEENMEWYVSKINSMFVANNDFEATTHESASVLKDNGKIAITKTDLNYWPAGQGGSELGWRGNLDKLILYLKNKKITVGEDKLVRTEKVWSVDGVVTGATMDNFDNYYILAKRAYDKALS